MINDIEIYIEFDITQMYKYINNMSYYLSIIDII